MTKNTLYLDLNSGISGDMLVGALIDLGVDAARLERTLRRLKVGGYHLHVARAQRGGVTGTRFEVHLEDDHPPHVAGGQAVPHRHAGGGCQPHSHPQARNFADIRALIVGSRLSAWVKRKAVAVFQRLAEAEGRIHGMPPDEVQFHEVGAVDSIVDIVGACVALELLGRPRVVASPVIEGRGWIRCAHGQLPVPAPATLAVLGQRGIPLSQCDEPHEMVTPTGAALLAELAEEFGPMTGLCATQIGYGLGSREHQTRPNALRVVLGRSSAAKPGRRTGATTAGAGDDWESDRVAVLETNLDDVSGELLGHFMETALAAGALDVFYTAIQMKKNRPGVLLTVLCAETDADRFSELILRETTAFGVRRTVAERRKLRRNVTRVNTPYGPVDIKLGRLHGQSVQAKPEFESCRGVAARAGVSVRQVAAAALRAWRRG